MLDIILNLLPLIASVVLILVFRYLDRNNRSVELAKKVVAEAKDNFEKYLKENSSKLQDMGTELETKQSVAVAAIKRLESIQVETNEKATMFQEKIDSISNMEKQLAHYDEILKDLVEMTANVEENLQRLQTESRFLDKTTKKINAQKALLDTIENRIPNVISDFSNQNAEELNNVAANLRTKLETLLEQLENQAEKNVYTNEELLSNIEKTYNQAVEGANSKATAIQERLISSEQKELEYNIEKLKTDSDEKLAKFEDDLSLNVENLKNTTKIQIESSEKEFADSVENMKSSVYEKISGVENDVTTSVENIKSSLKGKITDFENEVSTSVETAKSSSMEKIQNFATQFSSDVVEFKNSALSKLQNSEDEINNSLEVAKSSSFEKIEEYKSEIEKLATKYKDDSDIQIRTLCGEALSLAEKLDSDVRIVSDSVEKTLAQQDEKISSAMETEIERITSTISEELARIEAETKNRIETVDSNIKSSTDNFVLEINNSIKNTKESLVSSISETRKEAKESLETLKQETQQNLEQVVNDVNLATEKAKQELNQTLEKITNSTEKEIEIFRKDSENKSALLKTRLEEVDSQISNIEKRNKSIDQVLNNLTEATNAQEKASNNAIMHLEETVSKVVAESQNIINAKTQEQLENADSYLENAIKQLKQTFHEKETNFFTEIDKELETYKKDTLYRFERLDSAGSEIANLEQNLREAMKNTENKVNADFVKYTQLQSQNQAEFAKTINIKSDTLLERLHGLEGELNELKEKSYSNVSERLKVFEDEFFVDLRKREEALNSSLINWQANFNERVQEMTKDFMDSRKDLETHYGDEFKEKFNGLQEKLREQSLKIEEAIKVSEDSLREQISNCEISVQNFVEKQRTEMDEAKQSASTYIQNQLENYALVQEEQLKKYERELTSKIEQISQNVNSTEEQTKASLDVVLEDFSAWRQRMNSQYEEASVLFNEKLDSLSEKSKEMINSVSQVFAQILHLNLKFCFLYLQAFYHNLLVNLLKLHLTDFDNLKLYYSYHFEVLIIVH